MRIFFVTLEMCDGTNLLSVYTYSNSESCGRIHGNAMLRIFLRNVEICEIVQKKHISEHMFPKGSKK